MQEYDIVEIQSLSADLRLADGIWYSSIEQNISYPSEGNADCFAVEDTSFWFKHRNNCITSIVRTFPPEDNGTIFDIGGGNGFVSLGLTKAGFDVALVEPGKTGAQNAKKRGLNKIICATTSTAKFKPHSLPAIGLFDVIEHIEDDASFIREIRNLLRKDGLLYATVPSYSFLWSEEDITAGHFRRYTINGICRLLESVGLEIVFSTYIFRFLPLPILLLRVLPYKLGLSKNGKEITDTSKNHTIHNKFATKPLDLLLDTEISNLNRKKAMGFGGSCLVVAKNKCA